MRHPLRMQPTLHQSKFIGITAKKLIMNYRIRNFGMHNKYYKEIMNNEKCIVL